MQKIPYFVSASYLLVATFTYYMAVILQKSVKPFPHCTITETATPYPQNIAFRFVIMSNFGSMFLIYVAQYYIFKLAKKQIQKANNNQSNSILH